MSDLITQAPYIAALVIIVVIFTRSMDNSQKQTAENETKRDAQWREFLSEQRAQTTAALGRMSAEITSVSNAVATVHSEQLKHDAWTREAVDRMKTSAAKRSPKERPD